MIILATVIISLGIAFSNYWQLALVVLCFFPLTAFTGVIQGKIWSGQALTDGDALEEAGKMVSEAVEMIRTVAAFNRETMFDKKYNEEIKEVQSLFFMLFLNFTKKRNSLKIQSSDY